MSLQICAPVSVIRNEKPNNSNNTCPYKTAKVRHLPQQIQSLSAQPPLPNVKHALALSGWNIGRNVRIETRWATSNAADIRKHAAELAALRRPICPRAQKKSPCNRSFLR